MDYPATSEFPKSRTSPTSGSTSTTRSPPNYSAYSSAITSTEIPTIRYFTPVSQSSNQYESPYAKGEDLPTGRLTASSSRHPSPRSTGITPFLGSTSQVPAFQPVSTMSTYSPSSRGSSSYSSPGPRQQKVAASMASSSRNASQSISTVSHISLSVNLCYSISHGDPFGPLLAREMVFEMTFARFGAGSGAEAASLLARAALAMNQSHRSIPSLLLPCIEFTNLFYGTSRTIENKCSNRYAPIASIL